PEETGKLYRWLVFTQGVNMTTGEQAVAAGLCGAVLFMKILHFLLFQWYRPDAVPVVDALLIKGRIIFHDDVVEIFGRERRVQVVISIYVHKIAHQVKPELLHGKRDHLVFGAPYRAVHRHVYLP